MTNDLAGEPLKTIVYFNNGKIVPTTLFINNRPIIVKRIVLITKRREGQSEIITFSLESATAVYEVEFNKNTCEWTLKNILVDS